MKFKQKIWLVVMLVAMLATLFTTSALATSTRAVRPAVVTTLKVLADQPAVFRLQGQYTCDFVAVQANVTGKTITITATDTKIKYTGRGCDKLKSFHREVNLGVLVPGVYTIKVNPNLNGKGQKTLKGFIAPLVPTVQPAVGPAQ